MKRIYDRLEKKFLNNTTMMSTNTQNETSVSIRQNPKLNDTLRSGSSGFRKSHKANLSVSKTEANNTTTTIMNSSTIFGVNKNSLKSKILHKSSLSNATNNTLANNTNEARKSNWHRYTISTEVNQMQNPINRKVSRRISNIDPTTKVNTNIKILKDIFRSPGKTTRRSVKGCKDDLEEFQLSPPVRER